MYIYKLYIYIMGINQIIYAYIYIYLCIYYTLHMRIIEGNLSLETYIRIKRYFDDFRISFAKWLWL